MKLVLLIVIPGLLFAQYSDKAKPPVRLYEPDGTPIARQWVPLIHEKDCDPNGWKYNAREWLKLRTRKAERPRYYKDSTKGSNFGWDIG